jgi:hypothetical protein
MIIAGWSTFATQAAIAWCLARRVPYVLLIDESDRVDRVDGAQRWWGAFVEAAVRNAAAVLVSQRADEGSTVGDGRPGEGRDSLPPAANAAAVCVRDLARTAWAERSTRHSLPAGIAVGAIHLGRSLTRRARTLRTRSGPVGRHG